MKHNAEEIKGIQIKKYLISVYAQPGKFVH